MPFSDPVGRFGDILENIERIETYCAGFDLQRFMTSTIVGDAVERCLARISEAAVKLGPEAERLCPDVPWHKIRAIGNRLRHDYLGISQPMLWETVQNDLTPLKLACEAAIRKLETESGL